ncbi:amino acid ABC transporter permease [Devosia sp. Root635]|uniref:amino acid ABC transporter permease n=1 Tax=Devosia sp. Root635 TaxID=1736575 RepID=UPI0006FE621B|nr:amino acid ABC transporter permease [Devosia sp. Root635]KRA53041.1 ABC transporter permease [Devosia sp. Root635]
MTYQLDFTSLGAYWPQFLAGALTTLQFTLYATALGLVIGIVGAIARGSHVGWLRLVAGIYVEVVRNTPFLIQIFFLFFGLASLGLRMPIFVAAVLAMVINVGAYSTEIVRAGIESVHPSQIEAAESLGLSRFQIYRDIILKPALERVYPSLTSQFTLMMLMSSVTSQVSAEELTGAANNIQSVTFRSMETYLIVGLLYLLLTLLLKAGFWGLGQVLFPRRRRLGTVL